VDKAKEAEEINENEVKETEINENREKNLEKKKNEEEVDEEDEEEGPFRLIVPEYNDPIVLSDNDNDNIPYNCETSGDEKAKSLRTKYKK
jgi:hypothetical protein